MEKEIKTELFEEIVKLVKEELGISEIAKVEKDKEGTLIEVNIPIIPPIQEKQ